MITTLFYIIYMSFVLPEDSLLLPTACATIGHSPQRYYGLLYCAPFTGNTIYLISADGVINAELFTDDVRERIVSFAVTPFAFFVNNGRTIVRYFRSTMEPLEVIHASTITSFAITRSEEIVYVNPRERTVHFLDYTGQEKNRLEDIVVRDMAATDTVLYMLTPSHLVLYDGYGNEIEKQPHDGSFNGLHVQDDRVYLFTRGQQILYVLSGKKRKMYTLPITIQEIAGVEPYIYALDERGTVLYRFASTDF